MRAKSPEVQALERVEALLAQLVHMYAVTNPPPPKLSVYPVDAEPPIRSWGA